MKEDVKLKCVWCSNEFYLYAKEYDRQIRNGRSYFFCSRSCVASRRNKDKKLPIINKTCPVCKKEFWASIKKKGATFCSRSCASKGSVTELRRSTNKEWGLKNCYKSNNIGSIDSIAKGLRIREAWKYSLIKSFLDKSNIRYQFEFPCGSGIFDLALLDLKVFIEFDGPYHNYEKIEQIDNKKTVDAKNFGWSVVRIKIEQNTIIDPNLIYHLFNNNLIGSLK
jgi:very-short-patch-repair endonuclease/ribosomal protein L33